LLNMNMCGHAPPNWFRLGQEESSSRRWVLQEVLREEKNWPGSAEYVPRYVANAF